jgi:hypothetical protein
MSARQREDGRSVEAQSAGRGREARGRPSLGQGPGDGVALRKTRRGGLPTTVRCSHAMPLARAGRGTGRMGPVSAKRTPLGGRSSCWSYYRACPARPCMWRRGLPRSERGRLDWESSIGEHGNRGLVLVVL